MLAKSEQLNDNTCTETANCIGEMKMRCPSERSPGKRSETHERSTVCLHSGRDWYETGGVCLEFAEQNVSKVIVIMQKLTTNDW